MTSIPIEKASLKQGKLALLRKIRFVSKRRDKYINVWVPILFFHWNIHCIIQIYIGCHLFQLIKYGIPAHKTKGCIFWLITFLKGERSIFQLIKRYFFPPTNNLAHNYEHPRRTGVVRENILCT